MIKNKFRIIVTENIEYTMTREEKDNVTLETFLKRIYSQPWLQVKENVAVQVSQIKIVEKLK
mgnify:CR=1 FL=1